MLKYIHTQIKQKVTNMSLYEYLQLQPIDPQEDGTVSELDQYEQDDTIDLTQDEDGEELMRRFDEWNNDMHSDDSDR